MKASTNLILISAVVLLLASSAAPSRVNASGAWTGNDNGEWDVNTSNCIAVASAIMSAETSLTTPIS